MNPTEKHIVGATMNDQNLLVCLRIRPMNESEIHMEVPLIAHSLEGNVVVLLDPLEDPDDILRANRSREKQFVFDYVFNSSCKQEDVFNLSTSPLLTQVIEGYTATVFAYGATGTGKTHTMLGSYEDPGIMVNALESLFVKMEELEDDLLFQVSISYLEVYNEMIRDLLNVSPNILDLREDQNGVQVAGLSEIEVHTTDEVMEILNRGNSQRTVEATAANKHSSRSHAVLQVNVISRPRVRTGTQEHISRGRLFLIDLAGSERASNTHNRGKRMTEGAHINRSLLALGNCINALADPNTKRYVNYRDSKLTRLLKDALGGNCRTVMIAHISPTSPHFEDSRNTLVYANRAKHIRTKIHKNMYDVNFHLVQYNNIISELKLEINRLRNKLEMIQASDQDEVIIQSDRKRSQKIAKVNSWIKNPTSMNENVEEMKLKDQLLIAFQKHLSCKKSLSDNLNNDMDLSLEETRCQVIIKEWEIKKAKRIPDRELKNNDDEIQDDEKQLELAGMDLLTENDKVKTARTELKIAQSEKQKLGQQRIKLEADLDIHMNNIKQLEKLIPERIKPNRQSARQTLELLCRLHRLEARQTELQTENLLLRQHSTRHELIRTALLRHSDLCAQIIQSQAAQIQLANEAAGVNAPEISKELQMLLQLYDSDAPAAAISLGSDLSELDKNYFSSLGRILEHQNTSDSVSDLRDMTSNMSINEVGIHEEKDSNASNQPRNTPDTWDAESIQPTSVKNRMKSTSDDRNGASQPGYKPSSFGLRAPYKSISHAPTNRPNPSTSKQPGQVVTLPGIQGRQLFEPIAINNSQRMGTGGKRQVDNRSRSLEPGYNKANRRRVVPRLDPYGNTLYDHSEDYYKPHKSRYDYSSKPPNYYKTQNYTRKYNHRVPKSTINNLDKNYYRNQKDRANEIRKLNERKFFDDNFFSNDTLEEVE